MRLHLKTLTAAGMLLTMLALSGCSLLPGANDQSLQVSGLIEATEITIAPELSGRVQAVLAKESEMVAAGDILLQLDDTLYQARRQAAAAARDSAEAGVRSAQESLDATQIQYELTLAQAQTAEQLEQTDEWQQTAPEAFAQPLWYFSKAENLQSAQQAVQTAQSALQEAQTELEGLETTIGTDQFRQAEERLAQARLDFQIASQVLEQANSAVGGSDLPNAAQEAFDDAEAELEEAQRDYTDALTTDGAADILEARARVRVAQAGYDRALNALHNLQTGADSLEVRAAAQSVAQAQAALDQAQSAAAQAQAELDLIEVQMEKLAVPAPQDGVVLTRNIQPGEVLQPGQSALTLGDLEHLTMTVYLPEDRYGEVQLDDRAELRADSFPERTFNATVTRIAQQAEFTPRSVQTQEERQTTVYAVELAVENPDGLLKPGMPVDVTFPGISNGG